MREYPILVTTLMADRLFGEAIASHLMTIRHLRKELPAVRVDHVFKYGHPQLLQDGHNAVAWKYIEARKQFLAGDYQAFVSFEDDMIVPEDALVRLLNLLWSGVDIAYGLYCFRHSMPPKWSAATLLEAKQWRPISADPEQAKAAWGKVIDVAGVGQGCTAHTRQAMEAIPFQRRGPASTDWYMAIDAQKQELVQKCDMGLVCGHMSMTPSPRVIWPDPEAKNLCRVEFL